jgi:hypothetical protein
MIPTRTTESDIDRRDERRRSGRPKRHARSEDDRRALRAERASIETRLNEIDRGWGGTEPMPAPIRREQLALTERLMIVVGALSRCSR